LPLFVLGIALADDADHALPLFVLGIALADYADHALSLDDFAVLADRLDAGTNLHSVSPGQVKG
jgi:hypothetical protein